MTSHPLLEAVLAMDTGATAVNFYRDDSDHSGEFSTSALQRRTNLIEHLSEVNAGDLVVVGEAAGWRGARQSGVAFTSAPLRGLPGTKEASATVVQQALSELGIRRRALLWNAYPLHPHKPATPRSNRAPTARELREGYESLALAIAGRKVICVGRHAAGSVSALLGEDVASVWDAPRAQHVMVRHPSYGGAEDFRLGLAAAMS